MNLVPLLRFVLLTTARLISLPAHSTCLRTPLDYQFGQAYTEILPALGKCFGKYIFEPLLKTPMICPARRGYCCGKFFQRAAQVSKIRKYGS
jgi:hypothetical protein